MSTNIYHSLMKALTMEDFDELSCYPVRASASGAITELIEVRVYVMLSMDFTCHLEVGTMLVCH